MDWALRRAVFSCKWSFMVVKPAQGHDKSTKLEMGVETKCTSQGAVLNLAYYS